MRVRHPTWSSPARGLAARLDTLVTDLPLTSEQDERESRRILVENWHRLETLAAALESAPPGPVLDIGFGYGYSAAAIRAALPQAPLVVIDRPRPVVRSSEWRHLIAYLGAMPVLADAMALPFSRDRFAAVVAGELIEHLSPERMPTFLAGAAELLMPGAVLVITTPNLLALRNRILLAAGRSPFDRPLPEERFGNTFGHLREYSAEEVEDLLRSAGLDGVTCVTVARSLSEKSVLDRTLVR
ncbi:MAG: class I SAM-dependent methyltransferase [Armatimonadota bacterium]|nr:class I SAM-dependent methyltransferase [Armatimonadota bacterium]